MNEEARLVKLFKLLGRPARRESMRYELGEVRSIDRDTLSCRVQMIESDNHEVDVPLRLAATTTHPYERLFPVIGSRVLIASQGEGYERCWLLGTARAEVLELQLESKVLFGAGSEAKLELSATPKNTEVGAKLHGKGIALNALGGHLQLGNESESLHGLLDSLLSACKLLSKALATANVVTTGSPGTFPLIVTTPEAQPASITTKFTNLSTRLGRLLKR